MTSIQQLFIYPVKSMQGTDLSASDVQENGLQFDRIFMLTEPDGTFITARQYHRLLQLKPIIIENGIQIIAPNQQSIHVYYHDFSTTLEPTEVWENHFFSHIASIAVNRWLSDYLQKDVQLRWIGPELTRRVKRHPDVALSFADAYPYLLLNQASFDYLQQKCPYILDIRQFRGNIIIAGALPFAEDGWKTIKIGEVIFDLVKPCSRCVLTTIDIHSSTANPHNEPLKTLRQFRCDQSGEIDFGMNMIARNSGRISLNDTIEILATQPAKQYIKKPFIIETPEKSVMIHYLDKKITGNNQQTLLEQLEQHDVKIPYSCRSGICGRCQITLEDGEVTPLVQGAVKRGNRVLACSCIPKTDIKIATE